MNGIRRKRLRRQARALYRQGQNDHQIARHMGIHMGAVHGLLDLKGKTMNPKPDPNDPLEQVWLVTDPDTPGEPETLESHCTHVPPSWDEGPSTQTEEGIPPDMKAMLEEALGGR